MILSEWFIDFNSQKLKITTPSEIHLDLFHHKVIQDSYKDSNEAKNRWIYKRDWKYTTQFHIDKKSSLDKVLLIFEGIDTLCNNIIKNSNNFT